ncbi:glycoside hydrolase family 3 protein [Streptosporangium canum]|uniref:glycoside hydrolase family 3 protein n=1 Tax=Streptosporangium canum TaxID=324952 RepID=UPI0037A2BD35
MTTWGLPEAVTELTVEALADLMVRPSGRALVGGEREERLRARCGQGSGRIGKDEVTGAQQLRRLTQAASRAPQALPLLISVNQEGGRLNALDWPHVVQMPGSQALGAAADSELAEQTGAALGGQLRAVGMTWNLAPVCDLASWPAAPAVGARAVSSDPELVARLTAGFVRGLQGEGVAATAKHFPGLGGVRHDPHLAISVTERLLPGALLPFQAAVEVGVASVMVGSHVVTEFEDCPALYSPRTVTGLLRDRLGFDRVIVSENLSIPAVHAAAGGIAQAAVRAVLAGVDVVMVDSEVSRGNQPGRMWEVGARRRGQVVQALVAAVRQGRISRARLEVSAARLLRMHARFGLAADSRQRPWQEANARAGEVAERLARQAVTVVRGRELLPLRLPASQAVIAVRVPVQGDRRADSARHAPDVLPALLGEHHPAVLARRPGSRSFPAGSGAVIVYGYDSRPGPGAHVSQAAAEVARLKAAGHRVMQIALGDVDDLAGSAADVLIAAHSPHAASLRAVAEVLFGQLEAAGVLPLSGAPW